MNHLRAVPAKLRALSIEPLRERVDLDLTNIDWVIVGGESGSLDHPFDLAWARALRDQCAAEGVAFFMKQLGACPTVDGERLCLQDKHGGEWGEWPEYLRVRQVPQQFRELQAKAI